MVSITLANKPCFSVGVSQLSGAFNTSCTAATACVTIAAPFPFLRVTRPMRPSTQPTLGFQTYNNRNLFADHLLQKVLPAQAQWQAAEGVDEAFAAAALCCAMLRYNEARAAVVIRRAMKREEQGAKEICKIGNWGKPGWMFQS